MTARVATRELNERVDTLRQVETPEGVAITLRVAGPLPRGLAWFVDTVIRWTVYLVLGGVLDALGSVGAGVFMIIFFLGEWFYPVIAEMTMNGSTPGKKAFGLTTVLDDGAPVTFGASLLRNLLRFADFMPGFYLAGFMSMIWSADFRRLGDHVAGTVVIYSKTPTIIGELPEAEPAAPPIPLTVEEQRAVVQFARRGSGWTLERANEIARASGSLATGSAPAMQLVRMANWIAGRR